MLSHENVILSILQRAMFESTYRGAGPEMCLGVLPQSHAFALIITSRMSVYTGDGVVALQRFDLHETLQVIQRFRLGRLWMVPPMVVSMTKASAVVKQYDLSSFQVAGIGASPLSREIIKAFTGLMPGCILINQGYSLTEACAIVAFTSVDDDRGELPAQRARGSFPVRHAGLLQQQRGNKELDTMPLLQTSAGRAAMSELQPLEEIRRKEESEEEGYHQGKEITLQRPAAPRRLAILDFLPSQVKAWFSNRASIGGAQELGASAAQQQGANNNAAQQAFELPAVPFARIPLLSRKTSVPNMTRVFNSVRPRLNRLHFRNQKITFTMASRTAPYNDAMQLGQGFNSFTQEILAEDAVFIERLRADVSSASHHFDLAWENAQVDGSTSASEESGVTIATPTSTQWNRLQTNPSIATDEVGPRPVTVRDRKAPIKAFVSRFVDSLSEVVSEMKISSAVPILNAGQHSSDLGLPFDVRPFLEADLNYYLGIRVATREDRPASAFSIPQALLGVPNFHEKFGDCFISGFVEGGQLSALVSVQVPNKKKRAEVIASLDTILGLRQGKVQPATGSAESVLTDHSKITVTLHTVGGGTNIVLDDTQPILLLKSLLDVVTKFPTLAADQPERIYAILTRFDSVSSFHTQGNQNPVSIRYDHCALYANMLLDAFVEYKNIDRQLSARMAAVKAGSMRFEQKEESASARRFANSWTGITRAKRECMRQMIKILKEVEVVRENPDIATDDEREEPFEDPLVFGEYVPRVELIPDLNSDEEQQEVSVPLCDDARGVLHPAEKTKVKKLEEENPGLAKHTRMDVPHGSWDTGRLFCSLDYLKPDWILAEVSVNVWRGVVCTLTLRYTNGLITTFWRPNPQGKLVRLRLNVAADEKIVACSVESGRLVHFDADAGVRITALRLSTNRGSTLVGQPPDWAEPSQKWSIRGGTLFEDLQMVHFDPILEGGWLQGFWGHVEPGRGLGLSLTRIAPIWSNAKQPVSASVGAFHGAGESLDREVIPSGVWDTYDVHDHRSIMARTPAILPYENPFPDRPMPVILAGFRKMDTWGGANMRFSATTDFVTTKEFSIGVDQWVNSIFYGGEFSWVGVRPDALGIQAGVFETHGSVQRAVRFSKPFSKPPQVLTWISGLDLHFEAGKRVHVSATNVDENGFTMDVGCSNAALIWSAISWIAIDSSSHCAIGSYHNMGEGTTNASWKGECQFPKGKFSSPPKVLIGFSSFDLGFANSNPRFGTRVLGITKDSFDISIYSWYGSTISSGTVQWLAIPSEE
ncbi:phenylacetyl-ligase [Diplodia corticola]|uniref:Phenylacetyl-ligase n=1 Tax=Diplodia corticola TaxID=236234 RepID=A0A1J9RES6_9PEZI|nr:phenylacetyl-ligase [Diplodia corticola]OJD38586.1 phenylacetyl-ligase [Diplodia corticola]